MNCTRLIVLILNYLCLSFARALSVCLCFNEVETTVLNLDLGNFQIGLQECSKKIQQQADQFHPYLIYWGKLYLAELGYM